MKRQAERRGVLRYDREFDRYWIQCKYGPVPLHCGEVIGLRIGPRYIWGRLEVDMGGNWYMIFPGPTEDKPTLFTLRPTAKYEAKICR